jgi:hypothetical protein
MNASTPLTPLQVTATSPNATTPGSIYLAVCWLHPSWVVLTVGLAVMCVAIVLNGWAVGVVHLQDVRHQVWLGPDQGGRLVLQHDNDNMMEIRTAARRWVVLNTACRVQPGNKQLFWYTNICPQFQKITTPSLAGRRV